MTWPLQEEFNREGPISQVPMDWFETVARILNYLEGKGVTIKKSADPNEANPWQIEIPAGDEALIPSFPVSPAIGDMLYWTGVGWGSVSPGTSGQYLKSQGAGVTPTWDWIVSV